MANATSALRFYGVVDADDVSAVKDSAFGAEGVTLVPFRDLAAVVAPAPYVRVAPGDAELEEYLRVVDLLYERGPVVPAPPGTVFRGPDVLRHWLEVHYAKLHEALGMIERRGPSTPPYEFVRMELGG